jgi:hypothetical protein
MTLRVDDTFGHAAFIARLAGQVTGTVKIEAARATAFQCGRHGRGTSALDEQAFPTSRASGRQTLPGE